MKLFPLILLFLVAPSLADTSCRDYLADPERLLPAAAKTLNSQAVGVTNDLHISNLHRIIDANCRRDPEMKLIGLLDWLNANNRRMYEAGDDWIIYTKDGQHVYTPS